MKLAQSLMKDATITATLPAESREELIQDALSHSAVDLMSPSLPTPGSRSLELLGNHTHAGSDSFKNLFNPFTSRKKQPVEKTPSSTSTVEEPPPPRQSSISPSPTMKTFPSVAPLTNNQLSSLFPPIQPMRPDTNKPVIGRESPSSGMPINGGLSSIFAQDYTTCDGPRLGSSHPGEEVQPVSMHVKDVNGINGRKDSIKLESSSAFFNFGEADDEILEEIEPDKPRAKTVGSIWDLPTVPTEKVKQSQVHPTSRPMRHSSGRESKALSSIFGTMEEDADEIQGQKDEFDFDVDKVKTIWKED